MPDIRDNGWTLWKIVAIFVTPVVLLILVAGKWAYHKDGNLTLWYECWKLNGTEKDDCSGSIAKGPVFLELTRTMLCIALGFYAVMHMCAYNTRAITPPIMTFLGQVKARSSQICYFISGLLILSATIIYDINFCDYYSKNKEMKDLSRAISIYVGYICGSIIWVVSIPIAVATNTGFKVYIKKKLNIMKRTGQVSSVQSCGNRNEPQDVSVNTRCAMFACLCKRSREREGNNRTEQINGAAHTESSTTDSGRNSVRHEGTSRNGEVAPDTSLSSNRNANGRTRRSMTPPPSYNTGDFYANNGNSGTRRMMAPPPYSSNHYTNMADSRTRRTMTPPPSYNTDHSFSRYADNANGHAIITPPPSYNTDLSSSRYADNGNDRNITTPPPPYEEVIRNNP